MPLALGGNFEASSAEAIYHAALAGVGIARLSTYLVGDDLRAGRLVRLLPDEHCEGSEFFAVCSSMRNLPLKVRAFIDFFVAGSADSAARKRIAVAMAGHGNAAGHRHRALPAPRFPA